jgi:hypothetical protein
MKDSSYQLSQPSPFIIITDIYSEQENELGKTRKPRPTDERTASPPL